MTFVSFGKPLTNNSFRFAPLQVTDVLHIQRLISQPQTATDHCSFSVSCVVICVALSWFFVVGFLWFSCVGPILLLLLLDWIRLVRGHPDYGGLKLSMLGLLTRGIGGGMENIPTPRRKYSKKSIVKKHSKNDTSGLYVEVEGRGDERSKYRIQVDFM